MLARAAIQLWAGDPAVLRLMEMSVRASDRASVPITTCGQMSGNTIYTMLLLGLGLRHFSVAPSAIPEIKKVCRTVSLAQCEEVAQRAMTMENARDINGMLKDELRKAVPELVVYDS